MPVQRADTERQPNLIDGEQGLDLLPRPVGVIRGLLLAEVPAWAEASIWFCGPTAFGLALRAGLTARGLAPGAFHQEAFEFR